MNCGDFVDRAALKAGGGRQYTNKQFNIKHSMYTEALVSLTTTLPLTEKIEYFGTRKNALSSKCQCESDIYLVPP